MQTTGSGHRRVLRAAFGLAIAVTFLWPDAVLGEERKNSWETSILGGNTFYGNENRLSNEIHYGVRFGWYFTSALELEVQVLQTGSADLQDASSTLISDPIVFFSNPDLTFESTSYTARLLINPRNERRRLKPYILFGAGVLSFSSDPKLAGGDEGEVDAKIVTIGGGLRQRLTSHMAFRAEFETEYAVSEVYHNEHLSIGLTWVFGGGPPEDTDGDGVLDLRDHCPDTPRGALVDKHDGCPWDLDLDGILEGLDVCPETPQGWPVDERGCPLDSDADRVPDGTDRCADTMHGAIVDARGCPIDSDGDTVFDGIDRCQGTPIGAIVDAPDKPTAGCPYDTDTDSVFDGIDQCPLTPDGAWVDERGCPKDTDGDRVLDGVDECPDTPEGQKIDRKGCPRVRFDIDEPQILQNVKFHGTELYPGSDAWLMLLVDAARYWPAVKFEVGLYTDSEGGPEANRLVAQRRAGMVKAFLVEQGIDARRIVTRAYGAVNFIADNETEMGRLKNRRVEVKRLSGNIRIHPEPVPVQPAPEPTEEGDAPSAAPPAATGEGASEEAVPEEAVEPSEAPDAVPGEEAPGESAPDEGVAGEETPEADATGAEAEPDRTAADLST